MLVEISFYGPEIQEQLIQSALPNVDRSGVEFRGTTISTNVPCNEERPKEKLHIGIILLMLKGLGAVGVQVRCNLCRAATHETVRLEAVQSLENVIRLFER